MRNPLFAGAYELLPQSDTTLDGGSHHYQRARYLLAYILRRSLQLLKKPVHAVIALLAIQVVFNSSYSNPASFTIPPENVFIAANIVDERLVLGDWGTSLVETCKLLGPERTYVSVYGGPTKAIRELEARLNAVGCENMIVAEELEPIDWNALDRVEMATGEYRVKRIAYLAAIRNRALAPLDRLSKRFDKVLFLNDVFFQPSDAARLLFATNVRHNGKTGYKSACAVDFHHSWKFYDTFALRSSDGYYPGVRIYPWFTSKGDGISRRDVLSNTDSVRVKSCWGGMTAFDAKYFQAAAGQRNTTIGTTPIRFRAEHEPFWDSSECCLVHSDLQALPNDTKNGIDEDTGIYMNPFVRVTYKASTYRLLPLMRRLERLFIIPNALINHFTHMPDYNPRRDEIPESTVFEWTWVYDRTTSPSSSSTTPVPQKLGHDFYGEHEKAHPTPKEILEVQHHELWKTKGHFEHVNRTATRDGFCGMRQLLVIREGGVVSPNTGTNWENAVIPPWPKADS
ncbi:cryptococcal mannosyltransferase 1-domain-containing protein [Halenospora varia]|nr:cryptococcal mannosyltransferase 1-domain-containing protein [Halenospora varia]